MAANIPDLGAVAHLGGQFHHNIFDDIQKVAHTQGKKTARAQAQKAQATANARNAYANSAAQAVKQGRQQFAKNVQAQQKQANQAAKAHAQGVKSGKVAPAPGAPPRTFAMGSTPKQKAQAKTMQQQRNFAHGEALKFQAAQFKVKQQQVNNAHTEALKENKQRSAGTPVNASYTPVQGQHIPQATFSSQFTPQQPLARPQGSTAAPFSEHGPVPKRPLGSTSINFSG